MISALASSAPQPNLTAAFAASSTLMYDNEHRSWSILSFTSGDDRSNISHHFPGVLLGTTPKLLVCTDGREAGSKGPRSLDLPAAHSSAIYLFMISV